MTPAATALSPPEGNSIVNFITAKDGTPIYFKDWGRGPVVTFSHGWPLNADAWDGQMLFLAQHGFRVIAHDRRGHGRSEQASSGNDMNGYADDLAAVIETLDLRGRHDGRPLHRRRRSHPLHWPPRHEARAKAVLIAAVPPLLLKTRRESRRHCRWKSSMGFGPHWPTTVRSSTRISPFRSMAPTGRARKSRKARSISSGSGACRPGSRTRTTASRHFPKPTSPRT